MIDDGVQEGDGGVDELGEFLEGFPGTGDLGMGCQIHDLRDLSEWARRKALVAWRSVLVGGDA